MKKILKLLKKVIFSLIFIYSFNLIYTNSRIYIPLNISTIAVVTLLGFPGFCTIILISFLLY